MVVEDAETGYVGAVVRIEYGRMELEDRHGRRKPFPIGPGYLIDGRPVILTAPRRAAPNAAGAHRVGLGGGARSTRPGGAGQPDLRRGSTRRRARRTGVGRRPAHRGCGGRIPRRRRRSRRDRRRVPARPGATARRARRPPGGRARRRPASPTPSAGDRAVRTRSSSAIRSSTSGRPSNPAGSASRRGRSCRAAWTGSTACARPWAGRTPSRPTSPGPGSGSGASVRDWNDLEPALIGRVEELIDFVTQPAVVGDVVSRERVRRSV